MQHQNIILAGGTGFVGKAICNYFGLNNSIVVLSRQIPGEGNNSDLLTELQPGVVANIRYVKWDGASDGHWMEEFNYADLVINMAGKSVNCRYTSKNKQAIFESRNQSTIAIGRAIRQSTRPPKLWINAASATIYPYATDTARDEYFNDFEDGFSVEVCRQWEENLFAQRTPFTRKIALRMAIVLGNGGVMKPYFNLLKLGLGGHQGTGKQWYSWVHHDDVCRMIDWIAEHKALEGIYNCSSPNAVNNQQFMYTLRQVTHTAFGLFTPAWLLKIGAALIGTEPELVLKSRWVVPTKILHTGFQFRYPLLEDALKQIVAQTPRREYKLF